MGLSAAHEGYIFQDLAVAYFLGNSILENYDKLVINKKISSDIDILDDLSIKIDDSWVRFQFKHSRVGRLTIGHLKNESSEINIKKIIKSIKQFEYGNISKVRLCLAWKDMDGALNNYLEPLTENVSLQGLDIVCYKLNRQSIWNEGSQPVWSILIDNDISYQDFLNLTDVLIIEMHWPKISSDLTNPGPLEKRLMNLITERIGIGKYPNENRNPIDISSRLIRYAKLCRAGQKTVTPPDVVFELGLRIDFGKVPQKFPIDQDKFVDRKVFQSKLMKQILSNKVTLVLGSPGSGKSWSLTELSNNLIVSGHYSLKHYCHLEPGDSDAHLRIESSTMFGNLLFDLNSQFPEMKSFKKTFYAANVEELNVVLERISTITNKHLVIIVDGIDHISRVAPNLRRNYYTEFRIDLVEQLLHLKIPENVRLVIGSQPGVHLNPFKEYEDLKEIEIPPWELDEIKQLSENWGILSDLKNKYNINIGEFLNKILAKSEGNPLYTTYLLKTIANALQNNEIFNERSFFNSTPDLSGDIRNYYDHIIKTFPNTILPIPQLLAFLDFSVTDEELREIVPFLSDRITNTLKILYPILVKNVGQSGIRIYHESFKQYMRENNINIENIINPIINWLTEKDFFFDSRANRFLIPLLQAINQINKIKLLITENFIINSLIGGQSKFSIQKNLQIASIVAADHRDFPFLARLAELERASFTCYREHLPEYTRDYWETFAQIFGYDLLIERLLFEGKPAIDKFAGLQICLICDENNTVAPWKEYLDLENLDLFRKNRQELIFLKMYGMIRSFGINSVGTKIRNQLYEIESINHENSAWIMNLANLLLKLNEIEFVKIILDSKEVIIGVKDLFREALLKYYLENDMMKEFQEISYNRDIQDAPLIEKYLYTRYGGYYNIKIDFNEILNIDLSFGKNSVEKHNIKRWLLVIQIVAFNNPELFNKIKEIIKGDGWYRSWLIFNLNIAISVAKKVKDNLDIEDEIRDHIIELAKDINPFEGKPRACDLFGIRTLIHKSILKALILIKTKKCWEIVIEKLEEISEKTTTYLVGSPGGPLTSLALINIYKSVFPPTEINKPIIESIKRLIERSGRSRESYSDQALHEIGLAYCYSTFDQLEKSKIHWKRASRFLASYGSRKDVTMYELLDCITNVPSSDSQRLKDMLIEIHPLIENAVPHTDGKETRYLYKDWFTTFCNVDIRTSIGILLKSIDNSEYSVNEYDFALKSVLSQLKNFNYPKILLTLHFTIEFENDAERIKECLLLIENLLKNHNRILGDYYFQKLTDQVFLTHNLKKNSIGMLKRFAQRFSLKIDLSDQDFMSKAKTMVKRSPGLLDDLIYEKKLDWIVFLREASIIGIYNALTDNKSSLPTTKQEIKSFAHKLEEIHEAYNIGQSQLLIETFTNKSLNHDIGKKLEQIGNILKEDNYLPLATFVYVLAYTRSRGGWRNLGGREFIGLIKSALSISEDLTIKILASEIFLLLGNDHYTIGIVYHLYELFMELGKFDLAQMIWEEAKSVISTRVSTNEEYNNVFCTFNETEVPKTVEEGLLEILLRKINHPEIVRRINSQIGQNGKLTSEETQKRFWNALKDRNTSTFNKLLIALTILSIDPFPKDNIIENSQFLKEMMKNNKIMLNMTISMILSKLKEGSVNRFDIK